MSLKQVVEAIKRYDRFLITSHLNPEGDAVASQLALANLLSQLNKVAYIVDEDPVPPTYRFLPGAKQIRGHLDKRTNFEVAIIVDCGELKRIGRIHRLIGKDKIVVNIDHHIGNRRFGHINWVDTKASAVGEMIYRVFEEIGCEIKKETALLLYVAILTDTGSFRYSNTTSQTHRIVGCLLERGLKPELISQKIFEEKSYAGMRLLGLALSTLKKTRDGKIAWLKLTDEMFQQMKAKAEETENFINFASSLKGIKVAMLFRRMEGKDGIKVSFRSKGSIDASRIARSFGGGGHFHASGCVIKGRMNEVERLVLAKVKKAVTG